MDGHYSSTSSISTIIRFITIGSGIVDDYDDHDDYDGSIVRTANMEKKKRTMKKKKSSEEEEKEICGRRTRRLASSAADSSSVPGSPVLTLPSDEGKKRKKKKKPGGAGAGGGESKNSSSSTTSISISHLEEDIEDSHLHLESSGSDLDSELDSASGHIHMEDSHSHSHGHGHGQGQGHTHQNPYPYPQSYPQNDYWASSQIPPQGIYPPNYWASSQFPPPVTYPPPQSDWNSQIPNGNGVNSYMYYAKRSGTNIQSRVYEEPETERYTTSASSYGYTSNPLYGGGGGGGGFFGFSMGSPPPQQQQGPPPVVAPPSPPRVSTWDYLNFFDTYDNSNYSGMRYGYGSNTSSPDSKEVREREGIPELEDETDVERMKVRAATKTKMNPDNNNNNLGVKKKKKMMDEDVLKRNKNSGEGTSRAAAAHHPPHVPSSSSSSWPTRSNDSPESIPESIRETEISSETVDTSVLSSKSPQEEEEGYSTRKKGVSFEIDESPNTEVESSKMSSLTTLSVHGTRDLQEVVKEIKDEFETASGFGKEVAVLLEVGKLPYQPRATSLKVIISRILYIIAPSRPPPRRRVRISSKTLKLAKAYGGGPGKESEMRSGNLSSTLEKLYAWEKKLYKEVKEEERLRVIYEKMCKRLKYLDEHGAEPVKIDATQASIRKLLTKLNICIKAVDAIASRIHKLRDEELLPQITELIHGFLKYRLIRMWKSMFKCHQKQFQAIMESKMRSLRVHATRRETGLKATVELEMELLNWCNCFNNWVTMQKSYVESLNGWLLRCLLHEPEETADGIAPFSPSRMGAPAIFVICNDWFQAMERISEQKVSKAMNEFAGTLRQLWERQDEEQRQRIKAEFLSKDVDKRLRHLRMENGKLEHDHRDASSDKTTTLSKVHSGSGISPLDDLKVDLDSMRKKLAEEKARHKQAVKLVHDAASNSLQAGLTPIFEALGSFSSEVLKAHEQVRLRNCEGS
ncbi:hypothetical protein G4B88_003468 [Cannabis sativa]|uniref:DUF632 domain-containing protein n=1 Tax=Cannabis sativa TaxID=3483 RepID=A0A7J6GTY7_CANSA|nr:hypothetical protein G4B88_003468 [Cannabis sativa]